MSADFEGTLDQSPLIDVDISIFENVISVNKTIARAAARAVRRGRFRHAVVESGNLLGCANSSLVLVLVELLSRDHLPFCELQRVLKQAGVLALLGVSSARQLYAIGTFLALLKSVVVVYVIMVLWRQYMYKYCP